MARAVLSVREGPDEGNTIMLSEGVTVIGRGADSGIVVDEPGVSRQHASIRGDASGFWVVDLGSRNGTFVNDMPVGGAPHRLRNRDRIQPGGTAIHWLFMASEETMPMPRISDT